MQITEVAVQNIQGFPPTARVPLKAGLNAFVARDADLVALLRALFFPSPSDAAVFCVPGTAANKAAVTLVGQDGQSYRLVRDFAVGRTLLRSDPATRQAVKLSADSFEIGELLRDTIGLPEAAAFDAHVALAEGTLPSRVGQRAAPKSDAPAAPTATAVSFGGLDVDSLSVADARRRLPELRQELEKALRFEEAQDTLYRLQGRLGELSAGTEGIPDLEEEIAAFERKLQAFAGVKDVTAGVEAKIKKYPEAAARRDGALAELSKKRSEYEALLDVPPDVRQLFQDQYFAGGLAAGVACIAGALVFDLSFLWALDLVAFGVAAWGAWRFVDEVEESDRGRRRLTDLVELEKRVHKQYELDTQPVNAAIRALGVNTPEEVLVKLDERDMLEARRQALVRELEQRRADPRVTAIERERQTLQQEARSREAIVNGMGFTREPALIRRDLQSCEEAITRGGPALEPIAGAVLGAAKIGGLEPRVLVDTLRDRLAQYLTALTERRFTGLRLAGTNTWHVVASSGASGPLDGLPAVDRDMIYLGVRLALAERVAGPLKLPLFVDEPSLLTDASHRALFVKMLKSLGASTQVIVRAFDAPPASLVDHVAHAAAASGPMTLSQPA